MGRASLTRVVVASHPRRGNEEEEEEEMVTCHDPTHLLISWK